MSEGSHSDLGSVGTQGLLSIIREAGHTIITKRACGEDISHDCPVLEELVEHASFRGISLPTADQALIASALNHTIA